MANKLYNETSIQNIADAIRSVNGSSDTYKVGEMAAAISSISTGLNWSELNYDTSGSDKGTPIEIIDGFNYAKDIINNYDGTNTYIQDKYLLFWPNIDITGRYNYQQMFDRSRLLHVPPLTLGDSAPSAGTITTNYMFKETLIEEITINTITNNTIPVSFVNTFLDCKRLKKAQINCPANGTEYMFSGCNALTTINSFDTSGATNMRYTFKNCSNLVTAPELDTSAAGMLTEMFNGCTNLANVPIYDLIVAANMQNMFNGCSSLTDTSLDNILQMCISAVTFTGNKSLSYLGISNTYDSRITSLAHYSDFIDAGWIIR